MIWYRPGWDMISRLRLDMIRLMEKILHHFGCPKMLTSLQPLPNSQVEWIKKSQARAVYLFLLKIRGIWTTRVVQIPGILHKTRPFQNTWSCKCLVYIKDPPKPFCSISIGKGGLVLTPLTLYTQTGTFWKSLQLESFPTEFCFVNTLFE